MNAIDAFGSNVQSGGKHAIVIGGSLAGLLAARVLADYFEQVTIIERDRLPEQSETRQGVPQGNHVHLLMLKGANIFADLFPGFFADLEMDGALSLDPTNAFRWYHFGVWKQQFPGNLTMHSQSRPLLDYHVYRRVRALENVRIFDNCKVLGFQTTEDHSTLTGVAVDSEAGKIWLQEKGPAQLVVDTSGRGSQTKKWLEVLGFPTVEETRVKIDVGYATRIYRRPTDVTYDWEVLGLYPWPLDKKRIGYIFPIEGNRWIVTLSGYLGDHPPASEDGFLEFARNLSRPDIFSAIKMAEPLTPVAIHKFPEDRLRHYERLARMPQGLIVLGDAACSLNPIYGQGMTIAALGASALRDCLGRYFGQHNRDMKSFASRFQKSFAQALQVPWLLTTSEDFRYPEVQGKRMSGLAMLQGYTYRVSRLTGNDPVATQTFYEVLNMLKSPASLFNPRIFIPAMFVR